MAMKLLTRITLLRPYLMADPPRNDPTAMPVIASAFNRDNFWSCSSFYHSCPICALMESHTELVEASANPKFMSPKPRANMREKR